MTRTSEKGADAPVEPVDQAAVREARFQIQISRGLLIGFGGLVLLAVVAVLAVGLWAARQNTFDLLRDKSESTVELTLARIEQYLKPAEDELIHLGRQMENGSIDATNEADVGKYLSGALAATPQVRSVVLIRDDARMIFALRQEDGVNLQVVDISKMPVIMSALEAERSVTGLHWADVVRPETAEMTILNVRYPVHREGKYLGLLAATVRIDTLSVLLEATAETLGGSAFIIYDERFVLAHPRLVGGMPGLNAEHPLPTLAEVGDPLLERAIGDGGSTEKSRLERSTGIRIVEIGGEKVALLSRKIQRYGDRPWLVGVHFPAATLTDELTRLRWAAIAGGIVLLISLAVAYMFARYLSKPLGQLALAAQQVQNLRLEGVPQLPSSLFKEITTAAQAFNAMVLGLRWFEIYVPRNLVHRLVRQGDDAVKDSVTRAATVMFTDIVGFTSQSETMSATETASFLNEHFALLSRCVEDEGGTIDKFIGDAVMAFWGAPEILPDHAARACRAALAIRDAITADNVRRKTKGAHPIRVRIGLHTGEVIVGNIGAPGRINYTIVGDAVNTANRLEQIGKEIGDKDAEVTIVLSEATVRAAGDAIAPIPAGTHRVRGREEEIAVYRL